MRNKPLKVVGIVALGIVLMGAGCASQVLIDGLDFANLFAGITTTAIAQMLPPIGNDTGVIVAGPTTLMTTQATTNCLAAFNGPGAGTTIKSAAGLKLTLIDKSGNVVGVYGGDKP